MGSLVDILKESFAETILDISGTPYNVYSIIVTSDTDLTEFAGILEDVLPDQFPTEDYISIYLKKGYFSICQMVNSYLNSVCFKYIEMNWQFVRSMMGLIKFIN